MIVKELAIEWLQQQDLSKAEAFWKQALKGFTAPTPLVVARAVAGEHSQESSYGEPESRLSKALTSSLKCLAQEHELTINTLIYGVWGLLLSRYSGEEDVVFGATRACKRSHLKKAKSREELFINTLPVRVQVSPEMSLLLWLKKLQAQEISWQEYEYTPLSKIEEWSDIPDETSLFESLVVFENHQLNCALQEHSSSSLNQEFQLLEQTAFPLTVYVKEQESELSLQIVYQRSLFSAEHIACLLNQFQYLLEQIIASPEKTLQSYSLVTAESRSQLPNPSTILPEPQYEPITTLFTSWVKRTPEQPALGKDNRTWTYSELAQGAEELARVLIADGIERGDVVAVSGSRSFGLIASMLGVLLSGGVLLTLDRNLPWQRQQLMLQEAQAKRLFYIGDRPLEAQNIGEFLEVIGVNPDTAQVVDSAKGTNLEIINLPELSPEDAAYIFFTSGTSGVPKGVLGCHKGLSHFLNWQRQTFAVEPQDRCGQLTGLSFDVVLRDIFLPLTSGATLCLPAEGDNLEATRILPWLEREQISLFHTVPSLAQSWLANVPQGVSLRALRQVFFAGEPLTQTLIRRWRKAFPEAGEIVNLYGPTETTLAKCFYLVPAAPLPGVQPVGSPLPETQALILAENHQLCGIGEPGEIVIRTPFRSLGYINGSEENQRRFIKNPFRDDPQDLLYRTGDHGRYRPDGSLEILGRLDDQVKIRGIRIEPGEINTVLCQHSTIRESVVIAREDSPGDKRLVAYVVPNPGEIPTTSELRQFLKEKLPDYMVPSAFVSLDALPLTSNGKLDRRALPAADWTGRDREETFVAPRTPVEEVLAGIWSQVLGLERVGIHDNFFELGGHSLLATQIISRIRDTFQVELSLRCLFEAPTVVSLGENIEVARQGEQGLQALPLRPVSRDGELLSSFAQQGMWLIDQLDADNCAYSLPRTYRLKGQLNVAALEQSLGEIVRRHEVLRTTFVAVEGQPIQVIAPQLNLTLPVVDLRDIPETQREDEAQRLATEETQRPFDLTRGPLLRVKLLHLAPEEYLFLLNLHHIVFDGWSRGVFMRELKALYEAFSTGKTLLLPELPIQYADFAHWQRQWLQGQVLETQLDYWKQQLAGAPSLLELPTDHPRPPVQTFQGSTEHFQLNPDLTQRLMTLSQRSGATLFMTLLAAFATLLYRYSGQEDVVVGSPIAHRNRSETESAIGLFLNTLALRTNLQGNPTFQELLGRVQQVAMDAYAHQDVPFEQLIEALQPERSLSHSLLFQVMFVLQNALTGQLEILGVTITSEEHEISTSMFDLTLSMEETEQGLKGGLNYNTDLFDAATITRMVGHFQTLLEGIVANPQQRVAQLPLLTASEQHQLLVEWNDTRVEYPSKTCIHHLFEAQVERTPDAVAVVFEGQQLTYRELNAKANQLAHHLQVLGVSPDVLVGICMERSFEMIVGLLGILKAGGAYVPLDPAYPPERLVFMLEDASVPVLLTQQPLVETLPEHGAFTLCLDTGWEAIAQESIQNPTSSVTSDNLAYMIYTSGSTGRPKGVMVAHEAICNQILCRQTTFHLNEADRVLQTIPISFDPSVWQIFGPLVAGAPLIVAPPGAHQDSAYLVRLTAEHQITILDFVPSMLKVFLEEPELETCKNLRHVFCGGEPLPVEVCDRFKARLWATLSNQYGPTEACIDSTFAICTNQSYQKTVPIGRPMANKQVYVLDSHLQPVPIGVPGELYIGGGLARGYLNRPELTSEKFITNPFSDGQETRLYKTGDLVRYLPDGNLEFLGRIDHQVKIRGFRIELGEIEAVLSQHPIVDQTTVIPREDVPGDKRLVAYIVPNQESAATLDTPVTSVLRSFLKERLPEYMVPSAFVLLEVLPLTPNGKVDRRALPAPEGSTESEFTFVAPRTPIEELLAQIWADVLGFERVGIHNNFFELGGHSLLATQLMSRIRTTFGVEVPLRSLFEEPTIAELAKIVEGRSHQESAPQIPPLVSIARDGELPVSFSQQSLWLLDQLRPGSPFYNIPNTLHITGLLNLTALEQSLNEIIKRHEGLRTTFAKVDGQPLQVIAPTLHLKLPVVDLRGLSESDRQTEAIRLSTKQAQQPYDLAQGPLVRATLLQLGEAEHILLLVIHHIVSDGWSMGQLFREMSILYQAFANGQPSPLSELPIQYADFAQWQRQWLQGEVLEAQLSYWKKQLEGAPDVLELPTDRPRPAIQSFRGARQYLAIPKPMTDALKTLSQREGVSLYMTLLAMFQTLLYRYTGQEDILVGTPIANRNWSEIEQLIGFFVNTLVMRSQVSGNPTFRELLTQVRNVTLSAYAHSDLPFEKLVEELQPNRDLSQNPLFQVLFVFVTSPLESLKIPGLTLNRMNIHSQTAKFDLTLDLEETASGIQGYFEYSTDLFNADTIARMAGHFQNLLEGIVANPEQRLWDLPLLTAAEQQQLLVEWNDTLTDYSNHACVHQLFEAQVEQTPDTVAVVFEEEQLTYRELNARANQLAHYLQSLGVGPDVLVGICVERSLEMVIGLLGILKAGGAYVPLDPAYPQERLTFMLSDTQAPVLLTQSRLVESLPAHKAQAIALDSNWEAIARYSQENPVSDVTPDRLAYVIYTSGSTGTPKGVAMEHRPLANLLAWQLENSTLKNGAKTLQFAPVSFDVSFQESFSTWCSGGTLVLISDEVRRDAVELLRFLQDKAIERLFLPFVALQMLAEVAESHDSIATSLREVVTAGEQLQITRQLVKWFTKLEGCTLHNHYGPSESHVVTAFTLTGSPQDWPALPPIGRAIANTQIYVLDSQLQPAPIGVPGELYIGGTALARGYLNRPDLTTERFIPNPFSDFGLSILDLRLGDSTENPKSYRLYKTGDRARYLPDGNIEYLGRIDNQVKIRGYRIELGEIEAKLSQHQTIQQSVVLVREDVTGHKRLVAYVVPSQESTATLGTSDLTSVLRGFLKEQLPEYMVPSAFVLLESLPLTPSGKVDRRALPAPDQTSEPEKDFVSPRDAMELQLTRIWETVLDIEPISVRDNFFELGGHSLLAVRLLAEIEKIFGKNLPLATLIQAPTVEQLASILRQQGWSAPWSSLVPLQSGGSKRPLFYVAGGGGTVYEFTELARCLGTDQPFYGLQPPDVDDPQEYHTQIEALAAHYIKELRAVQPEGPYLLGGFCTGGVVAFEMAQQLKAQGQTVASLVLLDTGYPVPVNFQGVRNCIFKIVDFYGRVLKNLRNLRKIRLSEQTSYILKKVTSVQQRDIFMEQRLAIIQALRNYTPQTYSGRLVHFITTDWPKTPFYERLKWSDGPHHWEKVPTGGLVSHTFAAKHRGMMREPFISVLAEQLRTYLDEAQAND